MAIKAVIFDLDGTITKPWFDFGVIRAEMGLTQEDGPVWEAMVKMTPERRKQTEATLDYYEQKGVDESELNEGARETLSLLKKRGIKTGMLTRNKARNAWAVAQKHGLMFDAALGREDGPVKPDASGVLRLCEQFGIKPHEALMVGDYLFDIQCAKAAGAVAVLLANHAQADEFAVHADYTVEKIDEILHIIEEEKDE